MTQGIDVNQRSDYVTSTMERVCGRAEYWMFTTSSFLKKGEKKEKKNHKKTTESLFKIFHWTFGNIIRLLETT